MERTLIAFILMALLVAAGIGFGLYLRHNSNARSYRRGLARDQARRVANAKAKGP